MSNKQNLAEELTQKWQDDMEKAIKDPKIIEMMSNNISQAKEFISTYANSFQQNSQPTANDHNGDDQLHELKQRIDSIEARLASVEQYVISNSAGKSK